MICWLWVALVGCFCDSLRIKLACRSATQDVGKLGRRMLCFQTMAKDPVRVIREINGEEADRISIPSPPLRLALNPMFCVWFLFLCFYVLLIRCRDNYCQSTALTLDLLKMSERDPEFLREEWALYGIGAVVLLLRFATRLKSVGFKGFQGDDYMSILVLALFTMDAATVHIIYFAGTNVEASALQKTRKLTAQEIATYEYGSKEQLAAWYSYTALIWAMKGTMLFFFNRLTIGLGQHRYVKWLAVSCGVSYVAVLLTITFGCFPTQKNWQVVPDPGQRCTLKLQNFLVTVVLNVITDAAILAIPLPLLWGLRVPLRKKIIIALLLCSGLFVICAAIIRVVLTLGSHPSALNINRWGVRETIVGIVTINLPILKAISNKSFWVKDSFKSASLSRGTSHNLETTGPYEMTSSLVSAKRPENWDIEAAMGHQHSSNKSEESLDSIRDGSEEFIMDGKKTQGVTVETTYQVTTEVLEKGDFGPGWKYDNMGRGASKASVHATPVDK